MAYSIFAMRSVSCGVGRLAREKCRVGVPEGGVFNSHGNEIDSRWDMKNMFAQRGVGWGRGRFRATRMKIK